ncbi:MAG: sigma-70 family RNA polymerase sigma factor [Planctomycetota bacterium]|nr:sigma-70 family RNA polymerase sigma factor [Planctomycetota bacterium]
MTTSRPPPLKTQYIQDLLGNLGWVVLDAPELLRLFTSVTLRASYGPILHLPELIRVDSGASQTSSSASPSLIERARAQDPEAWRRLSRLYVPLVYRWARQAGLQENDAADIGQEVFQTVAARINDFRRDRPGDSFRGWMWGITSVKLREFFRRRAASPQAVGGTAANLHIETMADLPPEESDADQLAETRSALVHRALDLVRVEFDEKTWRAFWRATIDECKSADIAEELQMTPKAVRQAKYRVLRRLRLEMDGLT